MLKFSLFRMPVGVDWWFWLSCALLGGGLYAQRPDDWIKVGLWTGVVFVSILIHELGHAFAGRRFGAEPTIRLHGFGGTTYLSRGHFSRNQSILVSAAGPCASVLLGLIVLGLDAGIVHKSAWMRTIIKDGLWINFFWTLFNLLPIQPLDGGQILRDLLGPTRMQITRWVGTIVGGAACYWCFREHWYFQAIMLALLTWHNFRQEPVEGGVIKD